ncbi:DNA methyltransferase [Macrococcoides canis]|uniref:DNA methyltransferase n=1 Tax=Macrococcoides canis TaxID=1855823 RepID=UPI00165DE592|nr:site-specific DNA-methyltransferase [Macrococcus canis]QNR09103.1 hypothetical protein GL258_12520 [Macrococcus canis]
MFIEDKDAYISYNSTQSEPTHLALECDNLEGLKYLQKNNTKINTVFTDIPFNSAKKDGQYSYSDSKETSEYIKHLRERFNIVRDIMTTDAVLFLKINHVNLYEVGGLMDEIFGRDNRISIIIWHKGAGNLRTRFVKDVHEYILVYAKNRNKAKRFSRVPNDNIDLTFLESEIINVKGENKQMYYRWRKAYNTQSKYSKKHDFKYLTQDGIAIYPNADKSAFAEREKMTESEVKKTGIAYSFRFTHKRIYQEEINNNIKIDEAGHLYVKEYVKEEKVLDNYIRGKGMTYKTSSNFLKNILGEDAHFTYATPKPLVKYLLKLSDVKNGTVLDIYSGSGTLGISILEMNNELKTNNQFILLQNNENEIFNNVMYRVLKRSTKGYISKNGKLIKGLTGKIKILRYKDEEE